MDDHVIQVSCQKPSMSSEYPHEGPTLLYTLLINILTQNFQGIFLGVKQGIPWHWRWSCHPCLLSGTLNVLQVPLWRTPHCWHTSNKDINTKLSGYLQWGQTSSFMTSMMTLSSKYPFRNTQCPLCTSRTPNFWHIFNKDINMKLSGYFPWGLTRSSMMTRMTLTFKSPFRNHHHPPSTPIKERCTSN